MHDQPSFLEPLGLPEFYSRYWEKKPLHIERRANNVGKLVDFADIERLLSTQPLFYPGVQLTQSGKTIDLGSYVDDSNRVIPLRLLEQHRQGATIVLSQAQKIMTPLMDLCRETTRCLKMSAQTNVYVSPPGNQGFNAHYDTHDVFILQVAGAKTFNFYPSAVRLPCPDEQFDATGLTSTRIDESIRLTAGDTLYIPRGVVHDAVADDSESSIHITLGVYPILVRDVLQRLLLTQTGTDYRYRESLNPFATDVSNSSEMRERLSALLDDLKEGLKDPEVLDDVMQDFREELSLDALQDCRTTTNAVAGFGKAEAADTSNPPRCIRLRKQMIIHHDISEIAARIYGFGQIMEFDSAVAHVIAKLVDTGELVDNDLVSLAPELRDTLIERLRHENLVDVS